MRFTRKGFDDGRIHVMVEEDAGTSDAEWEEDTHLGPVDRVLGCTGWVFDTSIFDEATAPAMWTRRYPGLTPGFESTNVPGLFFAGTLMHGRDHRKSSGGFIHGFRYLVKFLHNTVRARLGQLSTLSVFHSEPDLYGDLYVRGGRLTAQNGGFRPGQMESRLHGTPWPQTAVALDADSDAAANALIDIIIPLANADSAMYQMFQYMYDVFVLEEGQAVHYKSITLDYMKDFFGEIAKPLNFFTVLPPPPPPSTRRRSCCIAFSAQPASLLHSRRPCFLHPRPPAGVRVASRSSHSLPLDSQRRLLASRFSAAVP